jgi:hypothetical protein
MSISLGKWTMAGAPRCGPADLVAKLEEEVHEHAHRDQKEVPREVPGELGFLKLLTLNSLPAEFDRRTGYHASDSPRRSARFFDGKHIFLDPHLQFEGFLFGLSFLK